MTFEQNYNNRKSELITDSSINSFNREIFRKFFEWEEEKLKRQNGLSRLDEALKSTDQTIKIINDVAKNSIDNILDKSKQEIIKKANDKTYELLLEPRSSVENIWRSHSSRNWQKTNNVLFMLHNGYKPKKRLIFSVISNNEMCKLYIFPNGSVIIDSVEVNWISLESITFRARDKIGQPDLPFDDIRTAMIYVFRKVRKIDEYCDGKKGRHKLAIESLAKETKRWIQTAIDRAKYYI